MARPTSASVIGSRRIRISSRETGTVSVTFSVTTYFRRRARPTSSDRVPAIRRSSDRVMASSVIVGLVGATPARGATVIP